MTSDPLYLTVHVQPRAGKEQEARALLVEMIAASRTEDGCELMEFVAPEGGSGEWLIFERWASRPLWEAHSTSERNARDGERLERLLAEPLRLGFFTRA